MLFVYSKFKGSKWKKYSSRKRYEILNALEIKIAKKLNLKPLDLIIRDEENWNCFGAFFTNGNGTFIYINSILLTMPELRFHAMETIAHETRHAYQYYACQKKLKWYNRTEKKWKENWESYFSSNVDNVMYNNQSVERDAQKYSIYFLKKHKYSDREYKITLENVVNRYNKAEIDAKREYGMFYKYKINKNIKKNSKIRNY